MNINSFSSLPKELVINITDLLISRELDERRVREDAKNLCALAAANKELSELCQPLIKSIKKDYRDLLIYNLLNKYKPSESYVENQDDPIDCQKSNF